MIVKVQLNYGDGVTVEFAPDVNDRAELAAFVAQWQGDRQQELPPDHYEFDASGYVVATEPGNKFRVWLYQLPDVLQRCELTVYWEQQGLLPFTPTDDEAVDLDSPPEKDKAKAKHWFRELPMRVVYKNIKKPNGKYVMVPVGDAEYKKKVLVSAVALKGGKQLESLDEVEERDPDGPPLWEKDEQQATWEQQQKKLAAGNGNGNGNGKPSVAGYPQEWRGPVDAQNWAVDIGSCTNAHEARNSFKNEVEKIVGKGKSLPKDKLSEVLLSYYEKHSARNEQKVAA